MTLPESSLNNRIFSSAYTALKRILMILLVINQSGTNFTAARQSSTALSHSYSVLYWSGTHYIEKGSSK